MFAARGPPGGGGGGKGKGKGKGGGLAAMMAARGPPRGIGGGRIGIGGGMLGGMLGKGGGGGGAGKAPLSAAARLLRRPPGRLGEDLPDDPTARQCSPRDRMRLLDGLRMHAPLAEERRRLRLPGQGE